MSDAGSPANPSVDIGQAFDRIEQLLEFPADFPLKVMGQRVDGFAQAISALVTEHIPAFDPAGIELRTSSRGTYLSLTLPLRVLGPIVFPLFQDLGVDPIHLAVVFVVNVILGLVTPPVGLILNVVGLIARVDPMAVFRDMLPYLAVLFAVLLLITYVPAISLWLPSLFMD